MTFTQSQLALYEAMKQHYPEILKQIKQRIAEGRWVVVDGWCEYDHTMPCGEAMIRQHLIAAHYARQELGCEITLAWGPDAFSGHAHTLPTILKGCGIDYVLFGRGMPENTPFFWWEGPDGSRVLAYTPAFAYSSVIGPHLVEQLAQWEEMTGAKEMLVLYGRGDHGGRHREKDLEALSRMRAEKGNPRMVHIVPHRFFEDVLAARDDIPLYHGELDRSADVRDQRAGYRGHVDCGGCLASVRGDQSPRRVRRESELEPQREYSPHSIQASRDQNFSHVACCARLCSL